VFRRAEPLLTISRRKWKELTAGLARDGQGRRESGAFLVSSKRRRPIVTDFVLYSYLDPDCLTGGIDFHGIGYHALGEYCRARDVRVIADVHTHPGQMSVQSTIDRSHPMVSRAGHVALIVPNFGQGRIDARQVGVHRLKTSTEWESWHGAAASKRLRIGWFR
jgi:hypothetical protein